MKSALLGTIIAICLVPHTLSVCGQQPADDDDVSSRAEAGLMQACTYWREHVAVQGGYVYFHGLDQDVRWGEGIASPSQIWVQPPGTPSVGMAFLAAYRATGDDFYLEAAIDAGRALIYGQLESGGWTNKIDFDPRGDVALYRNGQGGGRNNSSLDDGQTQSAISFLVQLDAVLQFEDPEIHEASMIALDALLNAQFPNGGFPQVWIGPVEDRPVLRARYPDHNWRDEGRIKEYWDMYTLNDNVCGYVAEALIHAHQSYQDDRYLEALKRLGDFLVMAQMPEPQRGWAQQYNADMEPIWARRFEPAAIASDETQEALGTLMDIYQATGDESYLAPIPSGLAYLKDSVLADGQLSRFYELESNRPLYMERRGRDYFLTYSDARLPSHYGWKIGNRIERIENRFEQLTQDSGTAHESVSRVSEDRAIEILDALDEQGRWVDSYDGQSLVGQPEFAEGERFLSSERFSKNVEALSRFLSQPN